MQSWIRKLKPIIWVVLICFSYTCVGGDNFVYAAISKGQGAEGRGQEAEGRGQTIAQEWTLVIDELVKICTEFEGKGERFKAKGITQTGETDVTYALKKTQSKLQQIDKKLKNEFNQTEEFLKEKNLPRSILDRHYRFVKEYEENYAKLEGKLKEVTTARSKEQRARSIEELKEFIEKAQYKPKPRPLDPNKLPHRLAPKLPARTPRVQPIHSRAQAPSPQKPTASDLAQTIDVKITDEIRKLANETLQRRLGSNLDYRIHSVLYSIIKV